MVTNRKAPESVCRELCEAAESFEAQHRHRLTDGHGDSGESIRINPQEQVADPGGAHRDVVVQNEPRVLFQDQPER